MGYVNVRSIAYGHLSLETDKNLWLYATVTLPLMAITYVLVWLWGIWKKHQMRQKELVADYDRLESQVGMSESVRGLKL